MARYLYAAIEHENFSGRAAYQTSKLTVFNAQLKVLITYPGSPGHRGKSERQALLQKCERVLQDADVSGGFSHDGRFLLILGSDDDDEDGGKLKWRCFEYGDRRFREMSADA